MPPEHQHIIAQAARKQVAIQAGGMLPKTWASFCRVRAEYARVIPSCWEAATCWDAEAGGFAKVGGGRWWKLSSQLHTHYLSAHHVQHLKAALE